MKLFAPLSSEFYPTLQRVEVATYFQLPSFHIVGLPAPEVAEARERIRAAIHASGIQFPKGKVIVNLSPASIRKKGTGIDLSMALAVLFSEKIDERRIGAWGELGLDGSVKPAGQITRALYSAWMGQLDGMVVSSDELLQVEQAIQVIQESGEIHGPPPTIIAVKDLKEAWEYFSVRKKGETKRHPFLSEVKVPLLAFRSDEMIRRESSLFPLTPALERILGMVVSGGHHFLILGPRGVGKSQMMEWVMAIQPRISPKNRLTQKLLAELAQLTIRAVSMGGAEDQVPFRRISSQVRASALLGGCSSGIIRPGEFSLAHGGVLLADELPEWSRDSREALREPLERKKVQITRTQGTVELPADFQFIATGNLCGCGGWPNRFPQSSTRKEDSLQAFKCTCTSSAVRTYVKRLSGPILDRIDCVLLYQGPGTSNPEQEVQSADQLIKLFSKVQEAQSFSKKKWGKLSGNLNGPEVELILQKECMKSWQDFLSSHRASLKTQSLRSRHKIIRLALTLAAWDGQSIPDLHHWIEASYYRPERFLLLDEIT